MVMPKAKVSEGDVFKLNNNQSCTVLKYFNNTVVKVRFNDEHEYVTTSALWDLRRGSVRNPFYRGVCGVGYLGVGKHLAYTEGKNTKPYSVWLGAMTRVYNKNTENNNPTYKDCTIHPDWHCYQNFAEWCVSQKFWGGEYVLDKDILVKGNRQYSPEFCCLVPREINNGVKNNYNRKDNSMPAGVYYRGNGRYGASISRFGKTKKLGSYPSSKDAFKVYKSAKEQYVRDLAEKWHGKIDDRVYQALLNWTI